MERIAQEAAAEPLKAVAYMRTASADSARQRSLREISAPSLRREVSSLRRPAGGSRPRKCRGCWRRSAASELFCPRYQLVFRCKHPHFLRDHLSRGSPTTYASAPQQLQRFSICVLDALI